MDTGAGRGRRGALGHAGAMPSRTSSTTSPPRPGCSTSCRCSTTTSGCSSSPPARGPRPSDRASRNCSRTRGCPYCRGNRPSRHRWTLRSRPASAGNSARFRGRCSYFRTVSATPKGWRHPTPNTQHPTPSPDTDTAAPPLRVRLPRFSDSLRTGSSRTVSLSPTHSSSPTPSSSTDWPPPALKRCPPPCSRATPASTGCRQRVPTATGSAGRSAWGADSGSCCSTPPGAPRHFWATATEKEPVAGVGR